MAMGDSPETAKAILDSDPLLGMMWEEYELCRGLEWVHYVAKSSDGKKEYPIHVLSPTHIATWPRAGGILDQPYLYVKVFRAFLDGEREGTMRRVQRMHKD